MRKAIDGESISDAKRAWDVPLVAAVVFGAGGANVTGVHTTRCHICSLLGHYVDDDASAW